MRPLRAAGAVLAVTVALACGSASAQNDWQFPDPYFGILEIEKSHASSVERRNRAEIAPAPRPAPARPRFQRPRRRYVQQPPR